MAISCRNLRVTIHDRFVGAYQPSYTLFVMPDNWEGKGPRERGETLQGGKYHLKNFDKNLFSVA